MKDALGGVQSVLLLGGASEIGLATVRALVDDRAQTVVLAARDAERLQPEADDLRSRGAKTVDLVNFDATDTVSHSGILADVFSRHGDIDVVILAFGVLGDQARGEQEAGEAVKVFETNTVGAASAALLSANHLRSQGHGTMVVLSSVAAERPRRSNFIYGASKAGIDALTLGLGDALAGSGVQVLLVRPGFVRTKMTAHLEPAPLATSAEHVAKSITRGLAKDAEIVWVPPVVRWVMVVLRHLPRTIFRRLPL